MDRQLEEKNDSNVDENAGNLMSDTQNSIAAFLQSPQFIETMTKSLLPSIVDGVKQSFSAQAETTNIEQTHSTGNSAGSPSGDIQPSTASGSTKGQTFPSSTAGSTNGNSTSGPPTKRPRLDNASISNTGTRVIDVDGDDLPNDLEGQNDTFDSEEDTLELTAQRWQASEELSALLTVCFAKQLTRFDKRQLIKSCPRPNVDCVYTPVLDRFLADLVPKCKNDDRAVRKTQDLLLDVTGPIAMCYEMVLQGKENPANLDLSALTSCLTKSLQLLGNVNDHIRNKRRAQVLSKIGPRYTSLSDEVWETNGKELFGPQFEQRLKQRNETAQTISSASFIPKKKQFFPRTTFSPRPWQRGGATNYYQYQRGRGQSFRPSRPFRGRGRGTSTFSNPFTQNQ